MYLEILQYLPPPDLGSYFCVNKHLYALTAAQRTKHQQLKRKFSTSLSTKQPGSTAKLIKNILADPQIALYVQHYTIDGYRDGWGWNYDDSDDESVNIQGGEHIEYTALDMAQLELAVRASEYVPIREMEEWIMSLKEGEEWVLVALALTMFPNLTSIDFQDINQARLLYTTNPHIVHANDPVGPLAKLIRVNINAFDSSSFVDPDIIELFSSLPSVKIINAEGIGGFDHDFESHVHRIDSSNVTDLNISDGRIPPKCLTVLLQSFRWLQSFTYWPADDSLRDYAFGEGYSSDTDFLFDACSIVTSLLACARDSLRELQIRAGFADRSYMGCLRKFRVLEYLETDTTLLFGQSRLTAQTFRTSLPTSIREVKLHGSGSHGHILEEQPPSFMDFRRSLPNLSSVELFDMRLSGNEAAALQDMFDNVNVSLTLVNNGPVPLPTFKRNRGHYAERQAKKALKQGEAL